MKIDAHQHFWKYHPQTHAWISAEMEILRRNYLPSDLQKELNVLEFDACIAVQADQSEMENQFLLSLAKAHPFIYGIVGWLDLRSPDILKQLETKSENSKILGFRHIVQDEVDVNFLLRKDFQHGITMLNHFDFSYDILVYPHQLGSVLEFVRKNENQKLVIDHLAKPYIKDNYFDGWANQLSAISKFENVYIKLSGMLTEADWKSWAKEDFRPYMEHILNCFGADRIMFGSDWPVCLLAGTYHDVYKLVYDFIGSLSSSEKDGIFGINAENFYKRKI